MAEARSGAGAYRFCPYCGAPLSLTAPPCCRTCGFTHYRNPIAVGAGVLLARGEHLPTPGRPIDPREATHLLLVRRTASPAGAWCIPCGYIEHDEEIRAGVERELHEETGLIVRAQRVCAVHSNFHDPVHPTIGIWFLVSLLGGELAPGDDAEDAAFFPLESPAEPLAFPTDRRVIADLWAMSLAAGLARPGKGGLHA